MGESRHTEIELKLFGKIIPILSIHDEKKGPSSEAETEEANGSKSIKGGEIIPCPRCSSRDTKFCYFNNYNVKQPRHFCRNCQRYWTAGGSIRNVPVGAGRRKTKSSNPSLSIPTHNFAFQFYPVPGFWSLGKRSREENSLWAPKTLRFDDSEKLSKCSWWEALGFQDENFDFASS